MSIFFIIVDANIARAKKRQKDNSDLFLFCFDVQSKPIFCASIFPYARKSSKHILVVALNRTLISSVWPRDVQGYHSGTSKRRESKKRKDATKSTSAARGAKGRSSQSAVVEHIQHVK